MKFEQGVKISKWFGDFGGNFTEMDTLVPVKEALANEYEEKITTKEFSELVDEYFKVFCQNGIATAEYTVNETKVIVAKDQVREYVMAGYMALAKMRGINKLCIGSFEERIAVEFAEACKKTGFQAKIVLSAPMVENVALVQKLKDAGAELDDESCVVLTDLPYAFAAQNDTDECLYIPVEGNTGLYPLPGLTALLSGMYGKTLQQEIGDVDAVAVPVKNGTEAIGTFAGFTSSKWISVEKMVSAEFHIEEGCYTLGVRYNDCDTEKMSTRQVVPICPQLAQWWREGKVLRIGCDRIKPVDVKEVNEVGITGQVARTVVLALESVACRSILVVEE